MARMTPQDLAEYLSDPVNLHNMGLVFWINKSVADIGAPMTISIMNTYIARTINSFPGVDESGKLQLADALHEELTNQILSNSDMDSGNSNNGIQ